MIGGLLFVLGNAMALAVSIALARFAFEGAEPWRRGFAALAAFPLVVVAALLLANALLPLTAGSAVALLAAPAAIAALVLRRGAGAPDEAAAGSGWRTRPPATAPGAGALDAIALALAGGLVAAWSFKTLLLGTEFVWDDLTYHAALPARWLTDARIALVPLTFQTYYPLHSEVFSLWLLLPFGGDGLASLAVFYWGLLAVAAVALLARALGADRTAAALAVALFLGSYVVWSRSKSFSAVDLAATAASLAALVFVAPGARRPARGWAEPAAAGLLAGFALGCRSFYLPVLLAVGAGVALRAAPRSAARALAVYAAGLLATGSYWYLRNWIATGNPLFPAALGPWDGPFGPEEQTRTQLAAHLLSGPFDFGAWREALLQRLNWPPSLALTAALGYAFALPAALRRGDADPAQPLRAALLLAGGALLLLYPFLPFSATANRPDVAPHAGYLRFLMLPYAVGALLYGAWLREAAAPRRAFWSAAAVLAIASAWRLEAALSVVAFLGGLAALALRDPLERSARGLASPPRALLAVSLGLAVLAGWAPVKQRLTDRNLYAYRPDARRLGDAWRALEQLPDGARIAFFMAEPFEYTQFYPTFGRRYQLEPVPVEDDGRPRALLHERWQGRDGAWWSSWAARAQPLDAGALARNLRAAGVQYVLATRWSLGEWPAQRDALARAGSAEVVWDDGYSTLWKVAP